MCGIVGALAQRNVSSILLEGLYRLEYRGYDSAGMALIEDHKLERFRALGKVSELEARMSGEQPGHIGIAHTRWATHGAPSESNAHPHFSSDRVAVVHNGIIENYKGIRERLLKAGYEFSSETDSEVVAHLIDSYFKDDLFVAVKKAVDELEGAFALGIIAVDDPDTLVACRRGNPLVVGVGIKENFVASDVSALLPVTNRFVYLEEGDYVVLHKKDYQVYDAAGNARDHDVKISELNSDSANKGEYRHYMLKEIHEQGRAIAECLEGRISDKAVLDAVFGYDADAIFDRVENVQIIACGTSYHAGIVARYWIEALLDMPLPGRSCKRISLPQGSGSLKIHAVRNSVAVGRNRGYAVGAAQPRVEKLLRFVKHLQCSGIVAGARVQPGHDDPRRTRNRGCFDQGLHDATGGDAAFCGSSRQAPKAPRR